jgi:DUF1365 family protein
VGIDYFDSAGLVLRTSIGGRKSVLNRQSATQALMRQPFMTFSIIARIYWQAVRLWLANVPFFPKPQVSNAASPTVTSENAITEKKP